MPRIRAVRILGALAVACFLGGVGGCAKGTPLHHDGGTPQQDANLPQLDAGQTDSGQTDGSQTDGPKDGALQQDAQHDAPIQQDAQHDAPIQQDAQQDVGECTTNADCFTDAGAPTDGPGIYCYTAKAICYEPGYCEDDTECKTGETCRPLLRKCSCPTLLLPCRPHETCILFPGFGNFCESDS